MKTVIAALAAFALVLAGGSEYAMAAHDDFEVVTTVGYDNQAQEGAYVPFHISVQNKGKDFTGTVQVIIPSGVNGENVMYEKDASISSGSTKTVTLTVPIETTSNRSKIRIVNKKGKELWSDYFKYNSRSLIDTVNIGVFSDDFSALSYMSSQELMGLSSLTTKLFEMSADEYTGDWRELDMLDVIVISNYSTDLLSQEQLQGLSYWVKEGGLLMVSTGSTASKTLASLNGEIFVATTDSLEKKETKLGLTIADRTAYLTQMYDNNMNYGQGLLPDLLQKYPGVNWNNQIYFENSMQAWLQQHYSDYPYAEVNVLDVDLKGATTDYMAETKDGNSFKIAQSYAYGNGYILLTGVDFTQNPLPGYKGSGDFFLHLIESSIGSNLYSAALDNSYGYYSNNSTNYYSVFSQLKTVKVPSILLFAVLVLAYVISVPIVYGIVKKKKGAKKVWTALPILFVFFAVIIYLAGFPTRMLRPELRNASFWRVEQNGRIAETKCSTIILPNNKGAKIGFAPQYVVSLYDNNFSYWGGNNSADLDKYSVGIKAAADAYNVEIVKNTALDSKDFLLEDYLHNEGTLDCDIYTDTNSIAGTITNSLGYTLNDTIVVCSKGVFRVGDIPSGSSVTISNPEMIRPSNSGYGSPYGGLGYYLYGSDYEDIFQEKETQFTNFLLGDITTNRKNYQLRKSMLDYVFENELVGYSDAIVIGFPDVKLDTVQSTTKFKETDNAILTKITPLNASAQGGTYRELPYTKDMVYSSDPAGNIYFDVASNSTNPPMIVSNTKEAYVNVNLPKDVKEITLRFDTYYYNSFSGDIYFYNFDTDSFDNVTGTDYMTSYASNNSMAREDFPQYFKEEGGQCQMILMFSPSSTYMEFSLPTLLYLEEN